MILITETKPAKYIKLSALIRVEYAESFEMSRKSADEEKSRNGSRFLLIVGIRASLQIKAGFKAYV
jgi:hypothetical protein